MDSPNAEQVRYWNETAGPKWVRLQARLDSQIATFGRHAMAHADIRPGSRVLDVGCGCGATSIEIGRTVGQQGAVTGIDVSAVMLAEARRAAAAAGMRHVRFEEADAQVHRFAPASVDVVFSRFGVMFFADPVAAFANLAGALAADGRLALVCWRAALENPWVAVPMAAAASVLPLPPPPAPGAPGPFSFADGGRVRDILERAGFSNVRLTPIDETLTVGGARTLDEAVDFLMQVGPAASLVREADPALVPAVAHAIREALEAHLTAEGVRMAGAAWAVSARRA